MRNTMGIIKVIFSLLIIILAKANVAGNEPEHYQNVVSFNSDQRPSVEITDSKYSDMYQGNFDFLNKEVRNKISVQIDPVEASYSYDLDVSLSITYSTYNGSAFESTNITKVLNVSNTSEGFKNQDIFYFSGAHFINVEVVNVSFNSGSGPVKLILSADILVNRVYDLVLDVPTDLSAVSHISDNGTVTFSWGSVAGAVEYDLEWAFVNSYGLTESEITFDRKIFERNATRVTTSNNTLTIPYIYDKGYIIYRVRTVGKSKLNNYTENLNGPWSSDPNASNCKQLDCITHKLDVSSENNQENLNWQFTVSYAEGGKNKVVGSYFDGSLRNRQTITKLNTNNKVLVGETIYDHQGRGAISVLPVPTYTNTKLEYKKDFNVINDNGTIRPYSRKDFDIDGANCEVSPSPMDITNGASQYYSDNNANLSGTQLYLPNAEGFPFVQTKFMPDNSGRILAQGGAGSMYQIGAAGDHVTRYSYATPDQKSLDQLFGSEAGKASHFKKNMVKDPNGQISVSYLDMSGKVVATALAGGSPQNLMKLSDVVSSKGTIDILNKLSETDALGQTNRINLKKGTLTVATPIVVTELESRTFNYSFVGENFYTQCTNLAKDEDGNPVEISHQQEYGGVYDLKIKLLDACGTNLLTETDGKIIKRGIGASNIIKNQPKGMEKPAVDDLTWTIENLQPGTYQLLKEIKVNNKALNTYIKDYMNSDESVCLMDLSYFLNQEMVNASFEGCLTEGDCDELKEYVKEFNPDCEPCIDEKEYVQLAAQCSTISIGNGYKSRCDGSYYSMLSDVSPMGQYGKIREMGGAVNGDIIDAPVGKIDPSKFPLSVFNTGNRLSKREDNWKPNWKHPMKTDGDASTYHYFDDAENIEYIQLIKISDTKYSPEVANSAYVKTGNKVEPQYLKNVEDFLMRWKPSWAKSLVIYHPEYPHYELCQRLEESNEFDYNWLNISYADAKKAGYILTKGSNNFEAFDPFFSGNIAYTSNDDLNAVVAESLRNSMRKAMQNYTQDVKTSAYYDIWDAVYQTLYNPNGCLGSNPIPVGKQPEEEWELFKYFYYGLKIKFVQRVVTWQSVNGNYYNKCIGEEYFNPNKDGFLRKFYGGVFGGIFGDLFGRRIEQPCNCLSFQLYSDKTIRFPELDNSFDLQANEFNACNTTTDPEGTTSDGLSFDINNCAGQQTELINEAENLADIAVYKQCGLCPSARDMQELLKAIVKPTNSTEPNGLLTGRPLDCAYPQLVPDLKAKLGVNVEADVNYAVRSSSQNRLLVQLGYKDLELQIINSPYYSISDIIDFCCLQPIHTTKFIQGFPDGNFLINATVIVKASDPEYDIDKVTTREIQLEGSISFNIRSCDDEFKPVCTPTKEVVQLQTLWNTLLNYNDFFSDGNAVKLNFAQDEEPGAEKEYVYNAIFNRDMVDHFDMICEPEVANRDWFFRNEGYDGEFMQVYIENLDASGVAFEASQVLIKFFVNGNSFDFSEIKGFGNIKPYDDKDYNFSVTVLVGTSDYFELLGNISYINPGNCQVALPTDFDPNKSKNSMAYTGYYECAPSPAANSLLTYLNTEGFWSGIGDNVEYISVDKTEYADGPFEIWLPPYNGYFLNEIKSVSDIAIDQNKMSDDGSSHFFTLLAHIETTDDDNNTVSLEMRLSGYAPEINIGNCFPVANLDCPTSEQAQYLMNELTQRATAKTLSSLMEIDIHGETNTVTLSLTEAVDHMYSDIVSFSAIWPVTMGSFYTIAHFANGEIGLVGGNVNFIPTGTCGEKEGTELVYNGDFETIITYPGYPNSICAKCLPPVDLMEELGFTNEHYFCNGNFSPDLFAVTSEWFSSSFIGHGNVLAIDGSHNPKPGGFAIDWMQTIAIEPNKHYEFTFDIKQLHGPTKDYSPLIDFGFIEDESTKTFTSLLNEGYDFKMYKVTDKGEIVGEIQLNRHDLLDFYEVWWSYWVKVKIKFYSGNRRSINLAITNQKFNGYKNDYFIDNISLKTAGSTNGDANEYGSNTDFLCDIPDYKFDPDLYNIVVDKAPCVNGVINVVKENARHYYEAFLEEKRLDFKANYMADLLNKANETFTMTNATNEHQYTLYYYDQAGNLIRTIPPEGVEKVTGNANFTTINSDRNNNDQTFFTKHRLATTYKYNSLNQLVAQSMPDHDDMEIRNITAANAGIPETYDVVATQFYNSQQGFAIANDGNSGFIYMTTDGGKTWTEATMIGINNLSAVQFTTSNTAYAVGYKGTVVKSDDSGETWTVLNIPTTADLVQLHFSDANQGLVFETNGTLWSTSDGGNNWVGPITGLANVITGNLTHVDFADNGNGLAVTSKGNIYATTDNGLVWKYMSYINASNLYNTNYNEGIAYASGNNGLLLKRVIGGYWEKVAGEFDGVNIDFCFTSTTKACLIDNNGDIFYSSNSGNSWTSSKVGNFVKFYNPKGAIVYAIDATGELYQSSDLGKTWNTYYLGNAAVTQVSNFYINDEKYCYVASTDNVIKMGTYPASSGSYSWTTIATPPEYNQHIPVDFRISSDVGTIRYNNGKIIHTATPQTAPVWTEITLPVELDAATEFVSMSFADDLNGYAITASDKMIRTNDGGVTWTLSSISYTLPDDVDVTIAAAGLQKVFFTSATNGTAVGLNGEIWTTTDGALTWESETLKLRVGALTGVDIVNSSPFIVGQEGIAFISGNTGTLLSSTDGARSWQLASSGTTQNLFGIQMLNNNEGVAVGASGTIMEYNAGTWTKYSGSIDKNLYGVCLKSSDQGIAVGAETYVLGGATWNQKTIESNRNSLRSVSFNTSNTNELICVGDMGKIYQSGNGGSSWTIANRFSPGKINALYQVNENTTYVAGSGGLVFKTTDNGLSWVNMNKEPKAFTQDLNAVYFTSETSGMVAGENGAAYVTTDGGTTWTQKSLGTSNAVNNIQFVNKNRGIMVGNNIAYYTQGGIAGNWTAATGISGSINAVHFSNAKIGMVVGDAGKVFKSVNGGTSWTELAMDHINDAPVGFVLTDHNLNDVHFIDTETGYIIGSGGLMLKTTDGGDLWTVVGDMASAQNYQALSFTDNYNMVVVGNGGTVQKLYDFSDQFSSLFYYDRLGRLVVSQNAKQYNENPYKYSFTVYDALGRIERTGEIIANSPVDDLYVDEKMANWLYEDWIEGNTTENITRTYYDQPMNDNVNDMFGTDGQQFLRNRVASTTYRQGSELEEVTVDGNKEWVVVYDAASHYSYDIHGNVKTLIQENKKLPEGQQSKMLQYDYDLISGNVLKVSYQAGQPDRFYHKYEYDADNRITVALTSRDDFDYESDAKYFYYDHGPLARIELGEHNVQGIDYAYTLQGWLKGVNSNTLTALRDMGKDADPGNINAYMAPDEFGFTLGYNQNDYAPIGAGTTGFNPFEASTITSPVASNPRNNLYNGNIGHMVTAIREFMKEGNAPPQAMAYEYDQLNRIKQANVFMADAGVVSTNAWTSAGLDATKYAATYDYDRNGNLTSLTRNSNTGAMDNLGYVYETVDGHKVNNRLLQVTDAAGYQSMGDIDAQAPNNYGYDALGNLVRNEQENIESIEWTVSGKVRKITRNSSEQTLPDMEFEYDPSGNRIMKLVKPRSGGVLADQAQWDYTYYVRDAQGNIMATYKQTGTGAPLSLSDFSLYGSDRLGTLDVDKPLADISFTGSQAHYLGKKQYELKNHLGNVLATVSDYAHPQYTGATLTGFTAQLLTAQDYYPFGMTMPGRSFSSNGYRFGFQGQEKDDEISGQTGSHMDFGARMYDSRVSHWLSLDSKSKAYQSNYNFAMDNPIIFIDPDGNDDYYYDKSTNAYTVVRTGAAHRFYVFADPTAVNGGYVQLARQATSHEVEQLMLHSNAMFKDAVKHASSNMEEANLGAIRTRGAINTYGTQTVAITLATPLAIIGAAEFGSVMASQYGKKVSKDFMRDVAGQFTANMILSRGNIEESLSKIDFANAALSAFSGNTLKTNSKSLEVLRKSLTAFAQTSLDLSIAGGADIKTASGDKTDIVNYYSELITRQLFAQISLPADDAFIKWLSDTGVNKTLRSLVQSGVETLFNEEQTLNNNVGNIKEKD